MRIRSKFGCRLALGCMVMCIGSSITQRTYSQRFDRRSGGGQTQIGGGGAARRKVSAGARPSLGNASRPSRPSGGSGGSGLAGPGGTARPQTPDISRPSTNASDAIRAPADTARPPADQHPTPDHSRASVNRRSTFHSKSANSAQSAWIARIGDRPIIGGGNLVVGGGNTNININNNTNNWFGNTDWGWGNQSGWNQGWGWNSGWNKPSWYHSHWNTHWGTSWYRPTPNYYVGWGLGSWATYQTFVNPYYVPSTTTVYNYSQPIVIGDIAGSTQAVDRPASEPDADTVALELFDEGVAAFKNSDFVTALNKFDTAMHRLSGDPVLHEMRALTYFSLGKTTASQMLQALTADDDQPLPDAPPAKAVDVSSATKVDNADLTDEETASEQPQTCMSPRCGCY